jgi:type VI protein secretion system component Hcp
MKPKIIQLLLTFILSTPFILFAQDKKAISVSPAPELEVNGIIFSSSGGVKFPDGTVQTTAYLTVNPATESGLSALVIEFAPASEITGPANGDGITNALNVLALSNGELNPNTTHGGLNGGGVLNASFKNLSFTRLSDDNSPIFRKLLADNTVLEYIEVFFLRNTEKGYIIDHKIRYEICLVSSFSFGSGGYEISENIEINFRKACYCSYKRDDAGNLAREVSFGWDIALNTTSTCNCSNF